MGWLVGGQAPVQAGCVVAVCVSELEPAVCSLAQQKQNRGDLNAEVEHGTVGAVGDVNQFPAEQ